MENSLTPKPTKGIMEIQREHFEAWLFSQSKDRIFRYSCTTGCLAGSYLNENFKGSWSCGNLAFSCLSGSGFFPKWLVDILAPFCVANACGYGNPIFTAADAQAEYLKLFPSPELVSETVQLLDHGVFETKEGV